MADVEVEIEETEPDTSLFNKKLIKLLNKARIQNGAIPVVGLLILSIDLTSVPVLPTLLQDIFGEADRWGSADGSGRIDPFARIHDVSLKTGLFPGPVPSFPPLACFPHDRAYDHMPRPDEEQNRSQEASGVVHDPSSERYPRLIAPALVAQPSEKGEKEGHNRLFYHVTRLHRS